VHQLIGNNSETSNCKLAIAKELFRKQTYFHADEIIQKYLKRDVSFAVRPQDEEQSNFPEK
jgi:hypothetical protein